MSPTGGRGDPYDAVIVGAGATGAWAAMRLGGAGMKVLLLDAGPRRRRISPLRTRLQSLLGSYLGLIWPGYAERQRKRRERLLRQPIQSRCYAWAEDPDGFVDDLDNPYVATAAPFNWFRSRQVGGRLAVGSHGLRFMRFTDHDLEQWPVSAHDLAPHYAAVERLIGWAPRECNVVERWLKKIVERKWPQHGLVPISKVGAPDFVALALATGCVTLQCETIVSHLELDGDSNEVSCVGVIDAATHRSREVFGRRVFLCGSTIESTRVLLNSRSARYPDGIGNASGVLGRHFMEQVHVFANVRVPAAKRHAWLPPQRIELFVPAHDEPAFGVQVMSGRLLGPRDMKIGLASFGEMVSRPENQVRLSRIMKDRWGVPAVEIDYRLSDSEQALVAEQRSFLARLQDGDIDVQIEGPADKPLGYAIHEVGTARMGDDPKTSFLDPYNRSWEVPNLFVTDGSAFVTSGYQNPTLTMLALTDRACSKVLSAARV